MDSYLKHVNRIKVQPELLWDIVKMHAAMDPEDRSVFEVRALRIFELLKGKGVRPNRIAALATAIDFRMTALARLQRDAALRGWSVPCREPGAVSISLDVITAAAEEQLIENADGQATFDPKSFASRVLGRTEPEGHA